MILKHDLIKNTYLLFKGDVLIGEVNTKLKSLKKKLKTKTPFSKTNEMLLYKCNACVSKETEYQLILFYGVIESTLYTKIKITKIF